MSENYEALKAAKDEMKRKRITSETQDFLRRPDVYEAIRAGMTQASAQEIVDVLCDLAALPAPQPDTAQ